jgi:hypothetical protein
MLNQGLMKNFQSKSARNFSITIRLGIPNRGPVDPEQVFNRDRDRGDDFVIRV